MQPFIECGDDSSLLPRRLRGRLHAELDREGAIGVNAFDALAAARKGSCSTAIAPWWQFFSRAKPRKRRQVGLGHSSQFQRGVHQLLENPVADPLEAVGEDGLIPGC